MINLSLTDLNRIQFDEKFTGQLLLYVESGRAVSNYHLPDGAITVTIETLQELTERARLIKPSFSTLPEFIELLTRCGYRVIQGVNHD
ncbi:hypothetical protein [Escherichia coli]|uniref:hypothetical protein n=1 Tax=Escherichia coli TaxID=562 RepID=UPI002879393E|nr:hypothetical protein [Escherichia coli]MDS1617162.1 hypothetical protein [Escherichia coli]